MLPEQKRCTGFGCGRICHGQNSHHDLHNFTLFIGPNRELSATVTFRWLLHVLTVHFMMCVGTLCMCCLYECTVYIFLWLRLQTTFPTIFFSMIQWKIPRLLLCWLRKQRGCNQSSGCFSHNPLCLSLHCFPIKGTLITGNSAGNQAGRWEVGMEKVEQTRL